MSFCFSSLNQFEHFFQNNRAFGDSGGPAASRRRKSRVAGKYLKEEKEGKREEKRREMKRKEKNWRGKGMKEVEMRKRTNAKERTSKVERS